MALVIEDGSIVAGANSYITVAQLKAYASDRGVELPADDSALEPMIVQAGDYLNSYEPKFKGKRVDPTQSMAWPRNGAVIYGVEFVDNAIPAQLIAAQCQAAILVSQGVDLMPNITGFAVRREKVDVIEFEYATGGGVNNSATPEMTPTFPSVEALLVPLIGGSDAGLLKVIRA